jgi:hypothetical protein
MCFSLSIMASAPVSPTPTINEKHLPRDLESGGNSLKTSSEPPDGGLDAWLTVLGTSLVALATFGCVCVVKHVMLLTLNLCQACERLRRFQRLLCYHIPLKLLRDANLHDWLYSAFHDIYLWVALRTAVTRLIDICSCRNIWCPV